MSELPSTIQSGLEGLESVESLEIKGKPDWFEDEQAWALPIRLELDELPPDGLVPAETNWYVLIKETYPDGNVKVFPAEDGGIEGTFPHQLENVPQDKPWTQGEVCVARPGWTLNQRGLRATPSEAEDKILWTVERLVEWLRRAAEGTLREEGDPFELPPYPTTDFEELGRLIFAEREESLPEWEERCPHTGYFHAKPLDSNPSALAVTEFRGHSDETFMEASWGKEVTESEEEPSLGIWLFAGQPPIRDPWDAPKKWRELMALYEDAHLDFPAELAQLLMDLPEGDRHPILVGFPIPEARGEPADRVHWQGALLPSVKRAEREWPGFRTRKAVERELRSSNTIDWVETANWAPDQLQTRGALSATLRDAQVLLIGAGSLGSHVAEQLVKGGVTDLTVLDGETLEGGNIPRHVLGVHAVGEAKAHALSERLNRLNPHADVDGYSVTFPPSSKDVQEAINDPDIVLDCTGSSAVAEAIARFDWMNRPTFLCASLGFTGRRLYLFAHRGESFPHDEMKNQIDPWLDDGRDRWGGEAFEWEGVGCWHPVSVVREDQVALWASQVCRHLDQDLQSPTERLTVLELPEGEPHNVRSAVPQTEEAIRWTADDTALSVLLHPDAFESLKRMCKDTDGKEVGGILLGRYVEDHQAALVTEVGDPPPDSIQTPTMFDRGTAGVNEWIREQERDFGRIYLGEWHYHPGHKPEPSPADLGTMNQIARDDGYACPEPIQIILGDPLEEPWIGIFQQDDREPLVLKKRPGGGCT